MRTIDIINKAKEAVPDCLKDCPWADLEHGTKVLGNDVELNCYMAAYGWAHAAKAYWAIKKMLNNREPECFEVFDWGCGQGIATTCLIDYLKEFGELDSLHKITLIEPSGAALQRAVQNIRRVLGRHLCRIEALQMYMPVRFGRLNGPVIEEVNTSFPEAVHFFSNVLDLSGLDFKKIAGMICCSGYMSYVICTGPVFKDDYMYDFYEMFEREEAKCVTDFKDGDFITVDNHSFSCRIMNFTVRCNDWRAMNRNPEVVPVLSGMEILKANALSGYFRTEGGTPFFRLRDGTCLYASKPSMEVFSLCRNRYDVIRAFSKMEYALIRVPEGIYVPVLL